MANPDAYPCFQQLLNLRYSCRNYRPDATPSRAELRSLIEAARLAPSACNRQPWKFLVADTDPLRAEIAACYRRPWAAGAGAFIVCLGDHSQAWHRPDDGQDHTEVDLAIASEHICLAAAALGLATCWICNFDVAALRKALNLPDSLEPVALLSVGYPADGTLPTPKNRKNLDEIILWEKF